MRCIRGPWRDSFPNYEIFDNLDVAYSNFITRLDCVINAIAPFKTVRIKNNASEWFDGEIAEKIYTQETNSIKNLNQQNCMLTKKSIKRRET